MVYLIILAVISETEEHRRILNNTIPPGIPIRNVFYTVVKLKGWRKISPTLSNRGAYEE